MIAVSKTQTLGCIYHRQFQYLQLKKFFLIMGQNLEKLSPQREVFRDKKPSQKRKERMRRPLTNICFSGHNLVKSFLFPLNLHIYGGENEKNMSDKTNKRTKILLQKGCQHSVLMWTEGEPEISC